MGTTRVPLQPVSPKLQILHQHFLSLPWSTNASLPSHREFKRSLGGWRINRNFYLYFFFYFFLNPKQCQDGWRAAPHSPASAERFCPRRKCGVPGQHCSPFVCSEPGSSRIKGSVRELLLQRGPGKQDSVPWLSYQHPASASAAKGSSARGAGRALLLEGSATIPVQHPE